MTSVYHSPIRSMTYLYHGYMLFTHLFPILLSRADKKCAVQKCLARTNRTTGLFQKKKKNFNRYFG